jgi:hypothetical protein
MTDAQTFAQPPRFVDVKSKRADNDWYQDQPEAIKALLRAEQFSGLAPMAEPACVALLLRSIRRADAAGDSRHLRERMPGAIWTHGLPDLDVATIRPPSAGG